jgi:hypothetical protein
MRAVIAWVGRGIGGDLLDRGYGSAVSAAARDGLTAVGRQLEVAVGTRLLPLAFGMLVIVLPQAYDQIAESLGYPAGFLGFYARHYLAGGIRTGIAGGASSATGAVI